MKKSMPKYDNADLVKVEEAMLEIVKATVESGKTTAFFDSGELLAKLKFSRLTRNQFHEQLSEVLCGSAFHREFGDWITGEYESNRRFLVRLAAPGEKQSINDPENHFFYNLEIRDKPKKKTQFVSVEIPADADPDAAAELMQELYANHQQ